MATIQETLDAANDFRNKVNENKKIQKLLKRWSPLIHFETMNDEVKLSLDITGGEIATVNDGHIGDADLVITFPDSDELHDMFSGRMNPTQKYLNGDIRVLGHQADVIKLDTITMILWPEL
ncbi:MAG: SCP2 sterol-binding domain-containing protein [Deltaproteobacteria bacterium]|nr:SCP2 sterol-binding domain-containing protein [Deltaproteobacteria bacterium]